MDISVSKFKELFDELHYKKTYDEWRVKNIKAGKDIVGENYENFREEVYKKCGFVVEDNNNILDTGYNCDIALSYNGTLCVVEEDKGHYVDSCFLQRAFFNAMVIFNKCIDNDTYIPYFIVSSPTTMNTYEEKYEQFIGLDSHKEWFKDLFEKKFKYLPLSKQSRISSKIYFKSDENCFDLDNSLIEKQKLLIKEIKNNI